MTTTDLTPRERPAKKKRSILPMALVALVVVAIGALLFRTLGDASLFFKNVDAAVKERDSLGQKRFRMQGTVVPGTITRGEVELRSAVLFTVSYNGVFADVASFDNPTELFKDGIPVVLEGQWKPSSTVESGAYANGAHDGFVFASDRILVKHDATYESKNKARLDDAEKYGLTSGATGAGATSAGSGSTAAGAAK